MKDFSQLKKNLKKDFTGLTTINVALLGDSATQLLNQALRGVGFDYQLNLNIWEADFNQIEQQIFDPNSEFNTLKANVVIIFQSSHKLLGQYNKYSQETRQQLADLRLELVEQLYSAIKSQSGAKIIYYNNPEIDDSIFGNYANSISSSFLFQLRKLNLGLMSFAQAHADFFITDISTIQNSLGKANLFQPSLYVNTEMVFSLDALPWVAARTLNIIAALNGNFKKCVIVDLDNTMWGGIIGDDGIENIQIGTLGIGKAFTEFQYWLKKLRERGIILAVCSKNTQAIAIEPFLSHTDMVLKEDDIAVFIANWENKVDNIRTIQNILNISFESMVFLDDNPFERNIVRENIAGITVPELPVDAADYLEYLYSLNLFETINYSGTDAERTGYYQVETKRAQLQSSFTDESSFLQNLEMVSKVEPFNKYNTPRVAQLSQRSNQFNLRTVRYSVEDIAQIANQNGVFSFTFSLTDKFGDNGLICVIILKEETPDILFIDTWFMSCRVLKRSMEDFTLNTITQFAKASGYKFLKGEYIATAKNEMVRDHYKKLKFDEVNGYWILTLDEFTPKECFITTD